MLVLGSELGRTKHIPRQFKPFKPKLPIIPFMPRIITSREPKFIVSKILGRVVSREIYPFYFYNRKAICYLEKKRDKTSLRIYEICRPARFFYRKRGILCDFLTKKCIGKPLLVALVREPVILGNRIAYKKKIVTFKRFDFIRDRAFAAHIRSYIYRKRRELVKSINRLHRRYRTGILTGRIKPTIIPMPRLNRITRKLVAHIYLIKPRPKRPARHKPTHVDINYTIYPNRIVRNVFFYHFHVVPLAVGRRQKLKHIIGKETSTLPLSHNIETDAIQLTRIYEKRGLRLNRVQVFFRVGGRVVTQIPLTVRHGRLALDITRRRFRYYFKPTPQNIRTATRRLLDYKKKGYLSIPAFIGILRSFPVLLIKPDALKGRSIRLFRLPKPKERQIIEREFGIKIKHIIPLTQRKIFKALGKVLRKRKKSLKEKAVLVASKKGLVERAALQRKRKVVKRTKSVKKVIKKKVVRRPKPAPKPKQKAPVRRQVVTTQAVKVQKQIKVTPKVKPTEKKQPIRAEQQTKTVQPIKAGFLDTLKSIPVPVLIGGGVLLLALLMKGGKTGGGYVPILYR